jgi:hypothetical protein
MFHSGERVKLRHARTRHAHEHGVQQNPDCAADGHLAAGQVANELLLRRFDTRPSRRLPRQRGILQDQGVFLQARWSDGLGGEEREGEKE